jgi:hypothetical protein
MQVCGTWPLTMTQIDALLGVAVGLNSFDDLIYLQQSA